MGFAAYYYGDTFNLPGCSPTGSFTLQLRAGTFLNDTAAGITYTGNWGYSTNRGYSDYQDDEHYTQTNGDSFAYTFTGTGVNVMGETNSGGGTDEVYVDGVDKGAISTVSQNRLAQQVLYSVSGLAAGSHSITVVTLSSTFFELDALGILQ